MGSEVINAERALLTQTNDGAPVGPVDMERKVLLAAVVIMDLVI